MKASFTYSAALGAQAEDLALAASGIVVLRLGSPSSSLLPGISTGRKLPHATKIDLETFYPALADLGYNFSGRFQSLSQLTRQHRKSSSLVRIDPSDEGESLLIHPAELDAAFQAILLAYSYPNDEQLSTLLLPTMIRHIRVNPALCSSWGTKDTQFVPIQCTLVPAIGIETGVVGDVNFYSNSGPNAIQIQGAKLVPLGGAAAKEDDKKIFSAVQWIGSSLDGTSGPAVDQHQRDVMNVLERISTFYLREFDGQLCPDHPSRSESPHSFYLDHARRTTSLIDSGEHKWATKAWTNDTLESVMSASSGFSELPDVRLMHLVGKHMPRVFRGETKMQEEFRRANITGEYYTNGVVIEASASWIIGMVKQLVDRHPHMNILEIGTPKSFPRTIYSLLTI
jgi:hypothetical protein